MNLRSTAAVGYLWRSPGCPARLVSRSAVHYASRNNEPVCRIIFAHDLLIDERAIHFGSVEEGDTALDSGANELDRFALLRGGTKTEAQAHTSEADVGPSSNLKLPCCFVESLNAHTMR